MVPIFNMIELERGNGLDELLECLCDKGVFYLQGGPASGNDHEGARSCALDFFENAAPSIREACTSGNPRRRRGYTRLESESTAFITRNGAYSDYSMGYSCGLTDNVFPDEEFERIWEDYFSRLNMLAGRAAATLATASAGIGFDPDVLRECDPLLRLRYYPDVPEDRCAEREPLRMAPHYDLSILTLIHQDACRNGFVSLQCEVGSRFVDLPTIPETVIVICGAVATLASGGRIKAPRHRVSAPPSELRLGSSRTSSVFFLRPRPSYAFSVTLARACGFDVDLPRERATFEQWLGGNYVRLQAERGSEAAIRAHHPGAAAPGAL